MTSTTSVSRASLSTPMVAARLGTKEYEVRFWLARLPELAPQMRGGRQRYTPADVAALEAVHALVHAGKSLREIRRVIRTEGVEALVEAGREVMTPDDSAIGLAVPDAIAPRHREDFRQVVRIVITRLRADPKPAVDDVLADAITAVVERGLPIEALNDATRVATEILHRASTGLDARSAVPA